MNFLTSLPGVVNQGLIWGIAAIGLYISYQILNFADLTVDGSFACGGLVAAMLIANHVNPILALLIAFIAGCLAGAITGFFYTVLGIAPILSGILTQLMLWSINLIITGEQATVAISARNSNVVITKLNEFTSMGVVIGVVIVLIGALYWFFGTELGASIRCSGQNENMARANGINTNWSKVLGLILSNGIVALSGAFLAQYQGSADINMGRGSIVIGLAAITIGLSIVKLFAKNFALQLGGCALGGFIYYLIYQLVIEIGLNPNLFKLFSALVVALFLSVPTLKNKVFKNVKFFERKERTHASN